MPNSTNDFWLYKKMLCVGILSLCASAAAASVQTDALVIAIAKGDQVAAQAAITAGADVNGLNSDDTFPVNSLTASVLAQSSSLATWLISMGADPAAQQYEALILALTLKDLDVALLFLHKLPSLPSQSGLLVATTTRMPSDSSQKLRALLLAKVLGQTPDEHAASSLFDSLDRPDFCAGVDDPLISVARAIISLGVRVDAASDTTNPPNATPLQLAINNGDVFLAHFLLSQGAQPQAGRVIDSDLLVSASAVGNSAGVQNLLTSHTNPNTPNYQGHYALPEALAQGQYAVAKQLLDAGVDPNLSGPRQSSALNTAARRDLADESALLISKGADLNKHDGLGDWPLRSAARSGSLDVLAKLISLHADIDAVDSGGNSALHNFIGVVTAPYSISHLVPVSHQQLGVVPLMQSAGFHFDKRNSNGDSILTTNLIVTDADGDEATGDIQYALLDQLAKAGAPIDPSALFFAVDRDDDLLITWLLSRGGDPNATRFNSSLLDQACTAPHNNPNVALALLHAGATLPTVLQDQIRLVLYEIQSDATDVVASLLNKGVALSTDPNASAEALDLALQKGNAPLLQLLSSFKININAQDTGGDTALHRLINRDLQVGSGSTPVITPKVEQAIAVMIQNGFNLSLVNHAGLTALQLAGQSLGTIDRLSAAIGMVNGAGSELHRAVRDNDMSAVISLLATGHELNAKDTLERTPLTLALQLHEVSIASCLLRHGAAISYLPVSDSQTADIAYATDPALAESFAVRLLSQQLLQLRPAEVATPTDSINQFMDAQSVVNPTMAWSVTCVPCTGTIALGDNDIESILRIRSVRVTRSPLSDDFSLIQFNIQPVPVMNALTHQESPRDYLFTATGTLAVPACSFEFGTQMTCYPGLSIAVDAAPGLSIVGRDGSAFPMPVTTVEVFQNGLSTTIRPGGSHSFDRSLGTVTVQIGPVTSKSFSIGFSTEPITGPSIDVPADPLLPARLGTYCRIAALRAELDDIAGSSGESLPIQAKTLAAAAHLIALGAVQRGYLAAVTATFASRAHDVLSLNDQMVSLRNTVISSSYMTADQIDNLITKLNLLIPTLNAEQASAAKAIRDQLQIAKLSAAGTNAAVRVFQDQFITYIDTVISEYQELALELAQYTDVTQLSTAHYLSVPDLAAIAAKLSGTEFGLADSAFSGKGSLVREAFGLPTLQ
jgi:ankyrin repeat protein